MLGAVSSCWSYSAKGMYTLLIVVAVAAIAQTGEGLHCYVCNSELEGKCGNPMDVSSVSGMECQDLVQDLPHSNNRKKLMLNQTENYVYGCQKLQLSDLQGRRLILRSCSIVRNKRASKYSCSLNDSITRITGGEGNVDYCGICYTDYCNTGIRGTYVSCCTVLFGVAVAFVFHAIHSKTTFLQ